MPPIDPATLPATNSINDPTETLQTFKLTDLARYTAEQNYSANASEDFHLFFVGRDNVHELLKYVLSRVSVSLYLNMFGYDDDELNEILMAKATDPTVTMLITLDKSQAGGVHEKQLIAKDQATPGGLAAFNTHFVIASRRRIKSATPRALLPTAKSAAKDRRIGPIPAKARSWFRRPTS